MSDTCSSFFNVNVNEPNRCNIALGKTRVNLAGIPMPSIGTCRESVSKRSADNARIQCRYGVGKVAANIKALSSVLDCPDKDAF